MLSIKWLLQFLEFEFPAYSGRPQNDFGVHLIKIQYIFQRFFANQQNFYQKIVPSAMNTHL